MPRIHETLAHRQRRGHDRSANPFDCRRRADDVDDGVDPAHLVKMHFFEGHLVHVGFGLPEPSKDAPRERLGCARRGPLSASMRSIHP